MRSSETPRSSDRVVGIGPAEIRVAVTGLVRLFAAHGREIRRKDARACVIKWLDDGLSPGTELERLDRLMRQAPGGPLPNRARHTAGGTPR